MGATKRIAELLVQSMNGNGCEMAAVRFGNVLGSNGSVVPTFKSQIAAGGPVTVTHPDMKRYFMTIPEAVSLVLLAGSRAKGGEVFVLDMGKPIKIYDLACQMIRLAGLEPGKDIPIEITGLRPGEKLYEELSLDSETVQKTESEKIFILHGSDPIVHDLERHLDRLQRLLTFDHSNEAVISAVFEIAEESGGKLPEKIAAGQSLL
jgi:FlaA1/EpsC-like NDP-sugar epimerase